MQTISEVLHNCMSQSLLLNLSVFLHVVHGLFLSSFLTNVVCRARENWKTVRKPAHPKLSSQQPFLHGSNLPNSLGASLLLASTVSITPKLRAGYEKF